MALYESARLRVLYEDREAPGNQDIRHFHPEYELYYLLRGTRMMFYRDRLYPMVAGNLAYVNGEEIHRFFSRTSLPYKRLVVCIKKTGVPGRWAQWLAPFAQGGCIVPEPAEEKRLGLLAEELIEECSRRRPGRDAYIEAVVEQMLILVSRAHERGNAPPAYGGSRIAALLEYLQEHYAEPVSLPALCGQSGLSMSHLTRLFKASTGDTVLGYVNSLRMKRAAELLRGDGAVSEIAAQAGCPNASYFDKLFRREYGLTPSQYRKRYRADKA